MFLEHAEQTGWMQFKSTRFQPTFDGEVVAWQAWARHPGPRRLACLIQEERAKNWRLL